MVGEAQKLIKPSTIKSGYEVNGTGALASQPPKSTKASDSTMPVEGKLIDVGTRTSTAESASSPVTSHDITGDDDVRAGIVQSSPATVNQVNVVEDGTVYAQESLEVVLIGAAFDQDVSVVFLDDGVYQIRKDQDTSAIGTKNFSKTFRALEMYDVEKLYVEKESMEARGMSEDLDFGGRLFYKSDKLDRNSGGSTVVAFDSLDAAGDLGEQGVGVLHHESLRLPRDRGPADQGAVLRGEARAGRDTRFGEIE